jgi:hypothetical protein
MPKTTTCLVDLKQQYTTALIGCLIIRQHLALIVAVSPHQFLMGSCASDVLRVHWTIINSAKIFTWNYRFNPHTFFWTIKNSIFSCFRSDWWHFFPKSRWSFEYLPTGCSKTSAKPFFNPDRFSFYSHYYLSCPPAPSLSVFDCCLVFETNLKKRTNHWNEKVFNWYQSGGFGCLKCSRNGEMTAWVVELRCSPLDSSTKQSSWMVDPHCKLVINWFHLLNWFHPLNKICAARQVTWQRKCDDWECML